MSKVWKVRGYPHDYWFFRDWDIMHWCFQNGIAALHVVSCGVHGNALQINHLDVQGRVLFELTWGSQDEFNN